MRSPEETAIVFGKKMEVNIGVLEDIASRVVSVHLLHGLELV